uniref:Uncharacterized protein n=1 Tax=Opuntia streptacantha TaxID=393608 RepID=A0A7C9CTD8_OPUST
MRISQMFLKSYSQNRTCKKKKSLLQLCPQFSLQPERSRKRLLIYYSRIFWITPAPTVLPPSLIANLIPSSQATGAMSSTTILTRSPGITILDSSSLSFIILTTFPVTSVVLM